MNAARGGLQPMFTVVDHDREEDTQAGRDLRRRHQSHCGFSLIRKSEPDPENWTGQ